MQMTVVHLRLRGGGDVVIVLSQQLRVGRAVIAGMCENDGDGLVEEVKFVQDLGEVWSAINTTVRMS